MTQAEFEKATPEELAVEVERCKDPYYFYHTYWQNADGTPIKQYNREDWDSLMSLLQHQPLTRFRRQRNWVKPVELDRLFEYLKPKI
jgi:hypothetical protein